MPICSECHSEYFTHCENCYRAGWPGPSRNQFIPSACTKCETVEEDNDRLRKILEKMREERATMSGIARMTTTQLKMHIEACEKELKGREIVPGQWVVTDMGDCLRVAEELFNGDFRCINAIGYDVQISGEYLEVIRQPEEIRKGDMVLHRETGYICIAAEDPAQETGHGYALVQPHEAFEHLVQGAE